MYTSHLISIRQQTDDQHTMNSTVLHILCRPHISYPAMQWTTEAPSKQPPPHGSGKPPAGHDDCVLQNLKSLTTIYTVIYTFSNKLSFICRLQTIKNSIKYLHVHIMISKLSPHRQCTCKQPPCTHGNGYSVFPAALADNTI